MPAEDAPDARPARRWGSSSALLDDDEARRRLVAAAGRVIARQGSAQVSMAAVADEAGVARSTLYRYFPARDDLVSALLLARLDATLADLVAALPDPADAARSLPDVLLRLIGLVEGDPLNEALFSADSHAFVSSLELTSEPLLDAAVRHLGPLLERWRDDGQIHADVDVRDAVRWSIGVALMLLTPPWRARSATARAEALDRYFVRALLHP